ncbi:substrate-binding domain-containing protein [Streptomyces afghaniensis]|uniref:substrate-binding domain-containing protein n=1 Tax=Streptomyces afghaniensis TaxID=66865 RepID=UPI0037B42C2D
MSAAVARRGCPTAEPRERGRDRAVAGCVRGCTRRRRRPGPAGRRPEDLSLIGFDNTVFAQFGYVDLTTIDTPRQDMGATAVTLLTARIEDSGRPTHPTQLAPRLIVRSTTAPRPGV